jgi:hypothetical protein
VTLLSFRVMRVLKAGMCATIVPHCPTGLVRLGKHLR